MEREGGLPSIARAGSRGGRGRRGVGVCRTVLARRLRRLKLARTTRGASFPRSRTAACEAFITGARSEEGAARRRLGAGGASAASSRPRGFFVVASSADGALLAIRSCVSLVAHAVVEAHACAGRGGIRGALSARRQYRCLVRARPARAAGFSVFEVACIAHAGTD
jgi:hypothetical protein